jgi:glycosyltransferase involved in cell wall biosynthesis
VIQFGNRQEPNLVIRINVYAQNRGWLFEDLKDHFRSLSRFRGFEVVVSDTPLPNADVWVALRTNEGIYSPYLKRTVICIHDLFFEPDLYGPGGSRRCVREAGALVFSHPEQRQILIREGVSLNRRPVLERPLGALKTFSLRDKNPQRFSIGWVGRNHPRKRLNWLLEAVKELSVPASQFEVVFIGEGLSDAATVLSANRIRCTYFDRSSYGIATYPKLYKRLDCLVITSSTEAGPLPLFEALATGLVVVSTPVGWAPYFAFGFPRYVRLANSIDEIKLHLTALKAEKDLIYDERFEIARLVEEWSLDGWIRAVLELAGSLTEAPNASPEPQQHESSVKASSAKLKRKSQVNGGA